MVFVQKLLPVPTALEAVSNTCCLAKATNCSLRIAFHARGDFDQVVSAAIKGHQFSDDELRKGIRVQFTGKANDRSQRLAKGETVSGSARVSDKKFAIEVKPQVEFYMSERDLT